MLWVCRGQGGGESAAESVAGVRYGGALAAVQQQLRRRLAGARSALLACASVPLGSLALLWRWHREHSCRRAVQVMSLTHLHIGMDDGCILHLPGPTILCEACT